MAPAEDVLISALRTRINFEPYQYVPALRALSLPRPRLLLADDVGLGKTIEAGIILRELTARRRANRVLIVCPAGIQKQWRDELANRFGFDFKVFDSEGIREKRRSLDFDANPWNSESRIIASVDYIKRRDGEFQSLSASRWDAVIVDEAHHLAANHYTDDVTDRHRLARWLAEATDALFLLSATPHDGYDESLASLLELLEPSLVTPQERLVYSRYEKYLVRRLKRHILTPDGKEKFIPRAPVQDIPITLTESELALHTAVMSEASKLDEMAEKASKLDKEAIKLVATVLRKRAASSRRALTVTLANRQENLAGASEQVELRREHIRALRRGDTLSDADMSQLERDAHKNLLGLLRREGAHLRRIDNEQQALIELQRLLAACADEPESKMLTLLAEVRRIHADHPNDKVIIFSEYSDTVEAVAEALAAVEYTGKIISLTGDTAPAQRDQQLQRFFGSDILILVANDVAGEGLNLQEKCHRIIHFDLPYNPNRLEQRNGRIDRYGQRQTPMIAFLYAKDTYDGQVLRRLTIKIENQIKTLGSVGDVLGRIQQERIDSLLAVLPTDMQQAIAEAERQIDDEINRGSDSSLPEKLGTGHSDLSELHSAENAAESGNRFTIATDRFVELAVNAAGGRANRQGDYLVVTTPLEWVGGDVLLQYDALYAPQHALSDAVGIESVLHDDHPLVKATIRWVKASQYSPSDHHRLTYQVSPSVTAPELMATFVVSLRDGNGEETQRLEVVRVRPDLTIIPANPDDADIINAQSEGNVDTAVIHQQFEHWWQQARETAAVEVERRIRSWKHGLIALRDLQQQKMTEELRRWDQATVQAIIKKYEQEYNQPTLFGKPEQNLPPAVRRRLRDHRERARERTEFLQKRLQMNDPTVEPLGVLLRMPTEQGGTR